MMVDAAATGPSSTITSWILNEPTAVQKVLRENPQQKNVLQFSPWEYRSRFMAALPTAFPRLKSYQLCDRSST
jgi:hypothetical protein